MLDANMKAWLIEVNHAPSFKGGSKAVDNRIKAGCVRSALELLHVTEKRKKTLSSKVRKEWEKYFHEQARSTAPENKSNSAAAACTDHGNGAKSSDQLSRSPSTKPESPAQWRKIQTPPLNASRTSERVTGSLAHGSTPPRSPGSPLVRVRTVAPPRSPVSTGRRPPVSSASNPSKPSSTTSSPVRRRTGRSMAPHPPGLSVTKCPFVPAPSVHSAARHARPGRVPRSKSLHDVPGSATRDGYRDTFCLDACGFRLPPRKQPTQNDGADKDAAQQQRDDGNVDGVGIGPERDDVPANQRINSKPRADDDEEAHRMSSDNDACDTAATLLDNYIDGSEVQSDSIDDDEEDDDEEDDDGGDDDDDDDDDNTHCGNPAQQFSDEELDYDPTQDATFGDIDGDVDGPETSAPIEHDQEDDAYAAADEDTESESQSTPITFQAPRPSNPDEYIRVFSMASVSCRAKYAAIIKAVSTKHTEANVAPTS